MADTTSQILFQNIDHSLMHNSFSFETSSLKLYKFHNLDKFYIIEVTTYYYEVTTITNVELQTLIH